MRDLLGGKGANLAEMSNLGLPVPPGFTITDRGLHRLITSNGKTYPPELEAQVDAALGQVGAITGATLRRREPAAGLGALRRARLDAGHDGHRAQPRPQRRDRRGAGRELAAIRASPTIQLSPLHHDVFRRRARRRAPSSSRRSLEDYKDAQGLRRSTPISTPTTGSALIERYKEQRRGGARRGLPAGPAGAALGRDRRGVRLLDEPARQHLPRAATHPGELGHGRQRPGDGVRQHGRHLGHRRRLHPQSLDRRAARSTASS